MSVKRVCVIGAGIAGLVTAKVLQVGYLDEGFYDEYYRPGSLSDTSRRHQQRWHQRDEGRD